MFGGAKPAREDGMRVQGQLGDLAIDLQISLEDGEWSRLAELLRGALPAATEAAPVPSATPAVSPAADRLWLTACQLLREAGACEGPQLLADLQALAGSAEAGKRLLVRLRHSPQVRVEQREDVPWYSWLGDQPAP